MASDPTFARTAIPEAVNSGNLPSPHLGWAILVAALGFLPLGVIAVIQALRAGAALRAAEVARARKLAAAAKRWIIITVVVALLVDLVVLGAFLFLGAFPS
ncbi:MAG: hypothetical protein EXQ60_06200 [Candidatus Nanopelagicales bacterium]|nr:hypothetical protein [Candidatus Nanopelagicales bacterium]